MYLAENLHTVFVIYLTSDTTHMVR